jgi:hypothetical protein
MKTKKIVLVLILGCLLSGGVFAFDPASYPDVIDEGDILINVGVGFGTPLYGNMSIPPLSVSVDYALPIGGYPFTVGGLVGFNQSKYEWNSAGVYGYKFTYTGIAMAGRFGYHPDFEVDNLDVYATIALGYYIYTARTEYTGNWGGITQTPASSYSRFYYGLNVGARYFFTGNIGAFAELGYSALSYVTAGITIKL